MRKHKTTENSDNNQIQNNTQKSNHRIKWFLIGFVVSWLSISFLNLGSGVDRRESKKLNEIKQIIRNHYYDATPDYADLEEAEYSGLVTFSCDEYSRYIDKNDVDEYVNSHSQPNETSVSDFTVLPEHPSVGYIKISDFDEDTADEFKIQLDEMKNQKIDKLIIDLRDNLGGFVDQAEKIADYFVADGCLYYSMDKSKTKTYRNVVDDIQTEAQIICLMNDKTASTSELLIGTLKDRCNAILVGQKSFGKGIIQAHYNTSDGSMVKLTTEKYFTPNGNCIHGVGFEPDFEVMTNEDKIDKNRILYEDNNIVQAAYLLDGKG